MDVYIFAFSIEISVRKLNSVDPDNTLYFMASELGLHCLHNTPKQVPYPV